METEGSLPVGKKDANVNNQYSCLIEVRETVAFTVESKVRVHSILLK